MYVAINGINNNKSVYIMQSYRKENGQTSSRVYRKLGRLDELLARFSGNHEQMMVWAKQEAAKDTAIHNSKTEMVSVSFSQTSHLPKGEERCFHIGYLFLQQLFLLHVPAGTAKIYPAESLPRTLFPKTAAIPHLTNGQISLTTCIMLSFFIPTMNSYQKRSCEVL